MPAITVRSGTPADGKIVEVAARRWFWSGFVLFLASMTTGIAGFITCDTEAGTCPTWHRTMNFAAFVGTAVVSSS